MNACFACEKQLTEDQAVKGHFVCSNQRCNRFGLVTTVYLAPPAPEVEEAKAEIVAESEAVNKKLDEEEGEFFSTPKISETEGEVVKDDNPSV